MKLSVPQREAVAHPGNIALTACPGSGKTRALVAKLLNCLDEVRGTPRRIAAITYTNAATHEAEARVNQLVGWTDTRLYEVGTIHAFCLRNILGPFAWKLPEWRGGFAVATADSDDYQEAMASVADRWGLEGRRLRESFESLNRDLAGNPIVSEPMTEGAARDFWERLQERRLIDFCTLIYESYRLISEFREIAMAISSRFAWILVDEFQDTTDVQLAILERVADAGRSRFFIVGDPNQSLFRFAGARPEHMSQFAGKTRARTDVVLSDNYRSSRPLVALADRICAGPVAMEARGPHADCTESAVWYHVDLLLEGITELFLPKVREMQIDLGECAILSPWFWPLFNVGRQLKDSGVPIIGPGARPYSRRHLIAPLAEHVAAYVEDSFSTSYRAIIRELNDLIVNTTGTREPGVVGRGGRLAVQRILRQAQEFRIDHSGGVPWLSELARIVADALESEGLCTSNLRPLLLASAKNVAKDVIDGHRAHAFAVEDMAQFARPTNHLRLLTVHKAKGREFSAVAVIDVHDGRFPHFTACSNDEIEDGRRLLYVAATRAKRVLMFFTEDGHRDGPSPFLGEIGLRPTTPFRF